MTKNDIPKDMHTAVEATVERCQAEFSTFKRRLDDTPPPTKIYHYTDSQGLLGILESGKIRLTDVYGLNDPSEVLHALALAGEILTARAERGHPAAKRFASMFNEIMSRRFQEVAHFFVACFSHDEDELSQWRAYADNGHGFALGFTAKSLEKAFSERKSDGLHGSFPVTYDDLVLRQTCDRFVDELAHLISLPQGRGLDNPAINEYMRRLSVALGVLAFDAAVYFKHEAYKAEREYRFLHVRSMSDPLKDIKYRARRGGLVRFAEFDWKAVDRTMLTDIVIGPASNQDAARTFIDQSLQIAGLDPSEVRIKSSKIPYRS